MQDEQMSTQQLLNELTRLRHRVAELEESEAKPVCTEKSHAESKPKPRSSQETIPPDGQSSEENERMLKSILATPPVGIALARGRKLQWANEAWMKMFGFEANDEFVGKTLGFCTPPRKIMNGWAPWYMPNSVPAKSQKRMLS